MLAFSKVPPLKEMEVYNLTSLYEGYKFIKLIPPFEIIDKESNEFDWHYLMWLMNDQQASEIFFNLIFKVTSGIDVCILISDDPRFDIIIESLQKLISQRYGVVSNIINCIEDWDEITHVGARNISHIYNLEYDMNNNWRKLDTSNDTD